MLLSAAALTLLLNCARPLERNAAPVGIQTMAGLIDHESDWSQFAIGDNTARTSYCVPNSAVYPCTYRLAVSIATKLRAAGHSLDAGYAQINTVNWGTYGFTPATVFNACANLHAGADILTHNYRDALTHFPSGDDALAHALSDYNTGDFYANMGYSRDVIARAKKVAYPIVEVPAPPSVTGLPIRRSAAMRTRVATVATRTSLPALTVNHADDGSAF